MILGESLNVTKRDKTGQRAQDRPLNDPLLAWSRFLCEYRADLDRLAGQADDEPEIRPSSSQWIAIDPHGCVRGSGPSASAARHAAIGAELEHLVSPEAACAWYGGEDPPPSLADLIPPLQLVRLDGPACVVAGLIQKLERLT